MTENGIFCYIFWYISGETQWVRQSCWCNVLTREQKKVIRVICSRLLWKLGNIFSSLKTRFLRSSRAAFLPCLICKHLLNLQDSHIFIFLPVWTLVYVWCRPLQIQWSKCTGKGVWNRGWVKREVFWQMKSKTSFPKCCEDSDPLRLIILSVIDTIALLHLMMIDPAFFYIHSE